MHQLPQYIKSYFGIATLDDVHTIVNLFTTATIKKNESILLQGKKCQKLYFVQSGYIRVFANTSNKEITQWVASSSYFLTDLASFINDSPARYNMQAITDAEVYVITKTNYKKLEQLIPNWHKLEKMFIAKCFTQLEDRIFAHLSLQTEERYLLFFKQNQDMFNQVPLQFIASMLGMTAETFSRIRKKQLKQLKNS